MERYLTRFQMEDNTPIADYKKQEALLKRMEREGYLVKVRESTAHGDEEVNWFVGPRGKVEVGDDGVRGLTKAVWGETDEEGEQELERRIARSLGMAEKAPPTVREQPVGKGQQKRRGRIRKDAAGEDEDEEAEEEEDEDDGDDDVE
jgi:melanoma-associated antigen